MVAVQQAKPSLGEICLPALWGPRKLNRYCEIGSLQEKTGKRRVLPHTNDSLLAHTKRAAYQTAIWRRCEEQNIGASTPELHGWIKTEERGLEPQWSTKPAMPPAVTDFVQCGCKTGCTGGRCSCRRKDLFCTELCECSDCENIPEIEQNPDFSEESDLSESDDSDINF